MGFKTIKKVRVYEEIVNQIKQMIIEGELQPSQPLPTERELAERFGVSLVPTRQALTVLETLGLIKRKRGRGIYIVSESIDFMNDFEDEELEKVLFDSVLASTKNPVREAIEVRFVIEPSLAKFAAERATEEDLEEIEEILLKLEKRIGEKNASIAEDLNFHKAIAAAAKNNILLQMLERTFEPIWEIRERMTVSKVSLIKSLEGHQIIFNAIKNGDGAAAYRAMLIHLKEIEVSRFHLQIGAERSESEAGE